MDKIRIHNLEIFCNHGVYPEENALGQKFLVSATLYTDTRKAGLTDDLTKSIHYGEVCHKIKKYMKEHTFRLIESAAEHLASYLLINTPNLKRIRLEIKKPWAPIGLPLETVSVEIERGWHTAYLGLGSNLGDKENLILTAVQKLGETDGCRVVKVSELISTKPYGGVEQDDFLNGCLELETLLRPEELLERLHELEQEAGRIRKVRWGPRTLDLDILLYDDQIVDTPDLTIPHTDMQNREFVLGPLAQIAPYKRHPILQKTIGELEGEINHG